MSDINWKHEIKKTTRFQTYFIINLLWDCYRHLLVFKKIHHRSRKKGWFRIRGLEQRPMMITNRLKDQAAGFHAAIDRKICPEYILDLCIVSLYCSLANQMSFQSILLEQFHHLTLKRKYNCLTVWIQQACIIIFPSLHDHRCHCESKAQQALALSGLAEGGLCIRPTNGMGWHGEFSVFFSLRDSFYAFPCLAIASTYHNIYFYKLESLHSIPS